jgi:hypothetical protein
MKTLGSIGKSISFERCLEQWQLIGTSETRQIIKNFLDYQELCREWKVFKAPGTFVITGIFFQQFFAV